MLEEICERIFPLSTCAAERAHERVLIVSRLDKPRDERPPPHEAPLHLAEPRLEALTFEAQTVEQRGHHRANAVREGSVVAAESRGGGWGEVEGGGPAVRL